MTRILRERDRLLGVAARVTGVSTSILALVCVALPGAVPLPQLVIAALLLVTCAVFFLALPHPRSTIIAAIIVAAALGAAIAIGWPPLDANPAATAAIAASCGGVAASAGIILVAAPARWFVLGAASLASLGVGIGLLAQSGFPGWEIGIIVSAWVAGILASTGLYSLVPHTLARIGTMTQAYQAERQASEREARRRQGARLLHDTVLATLTLLAHSGVGVSAEALRQQATEDAALLRQLRLGFDPQPAASGDYKLKPVEESALGNTLESVKHRFRRMGLEVKWHGSGQVLLPSEVLDAFLLALSECLENVRRHAQVNEANVTITDDDTTVRAMVTDQGVGFDLGEVDSQRLGFAESIVARLRDVGGKARLFSSPGSGTTVVLEVPK